ncbi:MAG: apolipoprotein N-acyltransferase [Alphaproteobacteria bacterium]|nr:apolipoprotein N-acyltransferase [Alphaproteobacteria bacterium]
MAKSVKKETTGKTKKKAAVKKSASKKSTAKKTSAAQSKKAKEVKTAAQKVEAKVEAPKVETKADTAVQTSLAVTLLNNIGAWSKLSALVAGAVLTAALPPFYYTWALFLAFSVLMFLLCRAGSGKNAAAVGYWFGFGYFAFGFYWIGNALLVDVAETGWLYPIVLLLNGAFFGLFAIIPALITRAGRNALSKMLLFAAGWCLIVEWLRGFILTGFPWNPVSSILGFSPAMLQVLGLFGTYGVSLLLVFAASIPAFWLLKPTRKRAWVVMLPLCMWLGAWQYGLFVLDKRPQIPDGHSLVIRLVQPSIPQSLKWDKDILEQNLQEYIDLSNAQDSHYIDFTVWGETASPFDLMYDYPHNRKVMNAVPRYGRLITGFLRREDNGRRVIPHNSLAVMNTKGEVEAWYDKSHLVPFGEYMPFRKYLPDWVRPLANVVAEFGRGEQYKIIKTGEYPAFAPLICYEVIFSDEVVKKGAEKPTWAVVLTNDGWYGVSSGPYQHLVAAQMRAAEEGISIVRSANSGISAVISAYGEIRAKIPLGTKAAIDALIKPEEAHQTLFGTYGNKIPLALSGVFLLLGLLCSLASKRKK